jgi:hypothetical protein
MIYQFVDEQLWYLYSRENEIVFSCYFTMFYRLDTIPLTILFYVNILHEIYIIFLLFYYFCIIYVDDSLTYFVNEEPIQLKMPSLIDQNGEYYIALDFILPYYEIQYSILLKTKLISKMPGVNVVSPTWFELSGSDGSIKNLGSLDYVNWAKKRGYQIWGLFSNAFDPDLTHEALKKYETRQSVYCSMIMQSKQCCPQNNVTNWQYLLNCILMQVPLFWRS